jgi:hypothetical protein
MSWLFRPSILVLVSTGLALSAVTLVLWPRTPERRAIPRPVPEGDQEIVWLYAATNAAPWERFVTAAGTMKKRLEGSSAGLELEIDDHNAFPELTTAVPELAISVKGRPGRLLFHWYKLTSDLKTTDWVKALVLRRPPPLAVIGGGSSDLAIELANCLREATDAQALGAAAPLLLLTTATADAADEEPGPVDQPLTGLYPGRVFRFCFTNRQMAEAVVHFVWSQNDLRPDSDPFYVTHWQDDPYSRDLNMRFCDALRLPTALAAAGHWGWQAGGAAAGGVLLGDPFWGQFHASTPESFRIPYSVGTFTAPNRWEVEEAGQLMQAKLEKYPQQKRPLLVVPADAQPTRRFLRALARIAPSEARHFVVVTGDAISFNTVYRDRNMSWPVQDLPMPLVFFCHRDPVDRDAGFQEQDSPPTAADDSTAAAGTEDLLLFVDILETLVQASYAHDPSNKAPLPAVGEALKQRLVKARWWKEGNRVSFSQGGQLLFDGDGNRRSGTGEHVVCLQPAFKGEAVLPEATITVWSLQADMLSGRRWWHRRERLEHVQYEGYTEER